MGVKFQGVLGRPGGRANEKRTRVEIAVAVIVIALLYLLDWLCT